MAWDASKPDASAYLVSADIRSNWAALADQALGRNLLGDPEYLIWGAGTSGNVPSWWNLSGQTSDGNIARFQSTTTITVPGSNSAVNLNYSSAALEIYQNALSTGDMTTSIKKMFDGQTISAGVWVYTNSADCKLVLHGPSSNVVSSAIGTGSLTWVTKSLTLASSTMVRLGMGVRVNASGATYVSQPTLVLGPIPPDYYIPGVITKGQIGFQLSGSPVTTGAEKARTRNLYPWRINAVDINALSATAGSDFRIKLTKFFVEGSCWVEIYSGSTTYPSLPTGQTADRSQPNGSYFARCFTPAETLRVGVDNSSTSGGSNPTVVVYALSYNPPLSSLRTGLSYR
jgi:hypothetical protein